MAYNSPYLSQADAAANANGIPVPIFRAFVNQVSGWNMAAVLPGQEYGLTGLTPNVVPPGTNIFDPNANLQAGASLLSSLYKKFGDWGKAAEAYQARTSNALATAPDTGIGQAVLSEATANGYTPSQNANTPNASGVTAPIFGLGDWLMGKLGVGPAGTPATATEPGLGDQAVASYGDSILAYLQKSVWYIIGIFVVLVVAFFAIKSLFAIEPERAAA